MSNCRYNLGCLPLPRMQLSPPSIVMVFRLRDPELNLATVTGKGDDLPSYNTITGDFGPILLV